MSKLFIYLCMVVAVLGMTSQVGRADEGSPNSHHQELQGVVVETGGALAVKVPNGATYQLNENRAERHGHALPKAGDEVTVVIDENNMVLEVHPKGTECKHRFFTGEEARGPHGGRVHPGHDGRHPHHGHARVVRRI